MGRFMGLRRVSPLLNLNRFPRLTRSSASVRHHGDCSPQLGKLDVTCRGGDLFKDPHYGPKCNQKRGCLEGVL